MRRVTSVKVTRSGNSKMLPVPAALATEIGAEIGDSFVVERVGDDIVYHPSRSHARLSGEGQSQIGVVPAGRAMQLPGRSVIPALDSWDF